MAKNLFILCEGPHDVAFLYKILRVKGYKHVSLKIKEFPQHLNDYFSNKIRNEKFVDQSLDNLKIENLPIVVVQDNTENLIFFYAIGSDSKKNKRKELINSLRKIYKKSADPHEYVINDEVDCKILYCFDADDKGIENRVKYIKKEIGEIYQIEPEPIFKDDNVWKADDSLEFSYMIFTAEKSDKGKLEDILLPMIKEENENIYEAAKDYLKNHYREERLTKLVIKNQDGILIESRTGDKASYNEEKSIIGIMGQLQNSGAANTTHIRHSDYLTKSKIDNSETCTNIFNLIQKLLS